MGTSYSSNSTTNVANDISINPVTTVTTSFDEIANALKSISNEELAQSKLFQTQQLNLQAQQMNNSNVLTQSQQAIQQKWVKVAGVAVAVYFLFKLMR